MNTMKRFLTVAMVTAVLGGALWNGMDAIKVRGCKPGISPRSNGDEVANNRDRERKHHVTAVAAVRG